MSAKSHSHDNSLIFAWGVRDHSTWHLVVALLVLMGAMAGFVGAVLGALLLIWLWQLYMRR